MSKLKDYLNNKYMNLKLYNPFCQINSNVLPLDLKNNRDELIIENNEIVDLVNLRALEVFYDLFNDEDEILFVINKYEEYEFNIVKHEDESYGCEYLYDESTYSQKHIRIKPYIMNDKVLKNLNCIVSDLGRTSDVGFKSVNHFYVDCKVKDIRYKRLIRELCENELINNFKGMGDYYIVHKEKEYVYHLCSDEWIDLSFNKNEDFEKFKDKYSIYIIEE